VREIGLRFRVLAGMRRIELLQPRTEGGATSAMLRGSV